MNRMKGNFFMWYKSRHDIPRVKKNSQFAQHEQQQQQQ